MAEALLLLTYLGIILLLGLICAIISKFLKIPNVLLLLFTGILISNIQYKGELIFGFEQGFIVSLGILALVMIVFDSSSKFKLKDIDVLSMKVLKVTLFYALFTTIFLAAATKVITGLPVYIALIFASFMAGTSPDVALAVLKDSKNKVVEFLELESIVNTPVVVLLPFLILEFSQSVTSIVTDKLIEQLFLFFQQVIVGIGAGVFIGLIVFKAMSRVYSERLSPIAIIAAALLTYVIAENLDGNGVLAVTTMAVLYGNVYVKHRSFLEQFSSIFTNFLMILVFVLMGLLIKIPLTADFLWKSLLLFLIHILIRWLALEISMIKDKGYNMKQKIFMAILAPKGIATAVVVFLLFTFNIPELDQVLNYALAFIIYSVITSTVIVKFSKYFLGINLAQ